MITPILHFDITPNDVTIKRQRNDVTSTMGSIVTERNLREVRQNVVIVHFIWIVLAILMII